MLHVDPIYSQKCMHTSRIRTRVYASLAARSWTKDRCQIFLNKGKSGKAMALPALQAPTALRWMRDRWANARENLRPHPLFRHRPRPRSLNLEIYGPKQGSILRLCLCHTPFVQFTYWRIYALWCLQRGDLERRIRAGHIWDCPNGFGTVGNYVIVDYSCGESDSANRRVVSVGQTNGSVKSKQSLFWVVGVIMLFHSALAMFWWAISDQWKQSSCTLNENVSILMYASSYSVTVDINVTTN